MTDQFGHQTVDLDVQIRRFVGGTGNNERRTSLIDENGIHFVNNGKTELGLHLVGGIKGHVVAQVIEAELVICRVHHVAPVGGSFFFCTLSGHNHTGGHAEKFKDLPHP